ncbi:MULTISPECIES: phosphatidylserine decarboxylase [Pontibacillus]|uniref:phosphatidylserine decarboxylase n=1 Tax=Pontibacillus chungwhensis TaxID=265426 RepID=A0ABY8V1G1_9BACI|nr:MULTISPECIES: phosphatidylserine decarboxylase [Pontibacillus]MCD5322176.1 phosphatidylserine decarboxylase [Pontibacillus sp. HN14]WIF99470.1 phosphatidylserine decarboxylase [Pontibacillus chungwhensis]
MKKQVYRGLIGLLNNPLIGRGLQRISQSSLSRWLIPTYVKLFHIIEDEAYKERKAYTSLEDFFIRELKDGARPIHSDENVLVSPVDARVERFGRMNKSHIEVKGLSYSIEDLLSDEEMSTRYKDGLFIVLYLSPSDYHRIHSPADAVVTKQHELGGKSSPVNKLGLTLGESPLSTNYRIVSDLKQKDGTRFAVVKVGAMWINTIELTHPGSQVEKGEEIGYFSFGSTVVLLFEKAQVDLHPELEEKSLIRVGEPVVVKKSSSKE